jgi:hypothetical protein
MSRFAIRPIVASLAVTLAAGAFAGAASAAPDASPPAAGSAASHAGQGHRFHHMQAMRDAFWLPGVGPIGKKELTELKLDARQQALFDEARQAQLDLRKSMRENAMSRRKTLDTQLQAGKLDPHALADAQAQNRQQMQGQADQVRQKWLALWDGLNDGQRQQVTQFVKERQARWEAHRKENRSGAGHHRPAPAAPATPSSAS